MSKGERTVPEALHGARLDKAIVELVAGASRSRVKRAIEAGSVRVNGRRQAKGAVVAKDDVISFATAELLSGDFPLIASPEAALVVCHESDEVLVLDKPAGQPCVPLEPGETGTLANAIAGRYPDLVGIGYSPREPGLVHRLDTETSGLVIAAKTRAAFEALQAALKEERIAKNYLLVCAADGLPDSGTIEFPIANHPKDHRRVYPCIHPRDVMRHAPRPASTQYAVLARSGAWALVRAEVSRALRHQIRAHFAAALHPLAGDTLYGGAAVAGLTRHALHAARVAFESGEVGLSFDVTSKLPDDMAALVPVTSPETR